QRNTPIIQGVSLFGGAQGLRGDRLVEVGQCILAIAENLVRKPSPDEIARTLDLRELPSCERLIGESEHLRRTRRGQHVVVRRRLRPGRGRKGKSDDKQAADDSAEFVHPRTTL